MCSDYWGPANTNPMAYRRPELGTPLLQEDEDTSKKTPQPTFGPSVTDPMAYRRPELNTPLLEEEEVPKKTPQATPSKDSKADAPGQASNENSQAPVDPSEVSRIMDSIDLGPTDSIQFMFAKLQLAQALLCKSQARTYMDKIENIQKEQQEVADMLKEARKLQDEAKTKGYATNMSNEMIGYFRKHSLTMDTTGDNYSHNEKEWDVAIKSLTNHQESISNATQTNMVFLQDFISQYNSYLQGAMSAIREATQVLTSVATGR